MSKKMASLQQALNASAAPQAKHAIAPAPVDAKATAKPTPKASAREGKDNLSVWLHPDFKKSLRLVQIGKTEKVYIDDLVAEALNDLFTKYDVPTVIHS